MKAFRVLVTGLALLVANSIGIYIGFLAYYAVRPGNQVAIQAPIAVMFSVLLYLAWTLVLRILPFSRLHLNSTAEKGWAFIASLVWGPVVFVPLHYFTQGYLTSVGNIAALIVFQAPVNAIAMLVAFKVTQRRTALDLPKAAPPASK